MEPPKKIINGLVFRDGDDLVFISLYDEKKKALYEQQYFTLNKGKPIGEDCFILVYFEEVHYRIVTYPIIAINIHNNNNTLFAKNISIDGLIIAAYDAAKRYLAKEKVNTSTSDSI